MDNTKSDMGQIEAGFAPTKVRECARIAAAICGAPIAVAVFWNDLDVIDITAEGIDEIMPPSTEWLDAVGRGDRPYVVPDAVRAPEYADHPWVVENPFARFFACIALRDGGDGPRGALFVLDHKPRTLTEAQLLALESLVTLTADASVRRHPYSRPVSTERFPGAPQGLTDEHLSAIVGGLPGVIFALDKNGVFTLNEGRALEVLGRRPGEVVGRSIYEIYADNPEIIAHIDRALAGESFTTESRVGNVVFECRYTPLFDENGEFVETVGIALDITGRRTAQAQLEHRTQLLQEQQDEFHAQQSQLEQTANELMVVNEFAEQTARRFRELFQGLPVACCSFNLNGSVLEWNRAFETLLSLSSGDILQRALWKVIAAPSEVKSVRASIDKALAGEAVEGVEATLVRPDGTFPKVLMNTFPLRGPHDEIIGGITTFVDITELDDIKQQLAEQRAFLGSIINANPNYIFVLDRENRYTMVNQATARLFGTTVENMIGRPVAQFLANNESATAIVRSNAETMESGEEVFIPEQILTTTHGVSRWVQTHKRLLTGPNGKTRLLLGIATDITERKRVELELKLAKEAAEGANIAKSRFLANMSHELRTPLNAIIGFSEILVDRTFGELTDKQAKYVGHILTSGRHLLQLINDILDLAKIEAGRLELAYETFDPKAALNDVVGTVKPLASKKQITLKIVAPGYMDPINADKGKFKQILYNLLSNAIKFTPDGGSVTLRAVAQDEFIDIAVIDTGIGIKPEDQNRIFAEFEQADSSYGRTQQGTGLGLALTKKLAELHGGRIGVESSEGKGSVFTVSLPSKRPTHVEERQSETVEEHAMVDAGVFVRQLAEAPMLNNGRRLVLVVEDNEASGDLLQTYLEEEGYRVERAWDGEEALQKVAEHRPWAITLDMRLPKKSGQAVLEELKGNPETANIPVVVVSILKSRHDALQMGAFECLSKPVDKKQLVKVMTDIRAMNVYDEPRRVLVVDDVPANVEILSTALMQKGFQVLQAFGGHEAVSIAIAEVPDLIILDLRMPDMNGYEVIQELQKDHLAKSIPIIVNTAEEITNELRRRLSGDVQAVVSKVTKDVLIDRLRGWKKTGNMAA